MAMDHCQQALGLFAGHYNCAQALLGAFGPDAGLDLQTCLKLAAPFGGGIGRLGEACGAVTGALLALGLRSGDAAAADPAAKAALYAQVQKFVALFKARHGSVVCRELLGCELATPEGWRQAQERRTHETVCPEFIRTASSLLIELSAATSSD
jgi:C_GCAxxG_C_C family probable redox protein